MDYRKITNQLTTSEYAAIIGKHPRYVTMTLSMLTMLQSTEPTTEAEYKSRKKRIKTRLNWLGDRYVSHEKKGNMYLITVKE